MAVRKLDPIILAAIKCGPVPVIRDITNLPNSELTTGEKVIRFAEAYCHAPDGPLVGQPIRLMDFQKAFILAVIDGDGETHVRTAIFSIGRRNGKSLLVSILALAALVGPLAVKNSTIGVGAMSRDQAGLIFRLIELMVNQSPDLKALLRCVPTPKKIYCMSTGVTLICLPREAGTSLGSSFAMAIIDEAGQIAAPSDPFVSAMRTSMGSYEKPRLIFLSTQAANDEMFLSKQIDGAIREQSPSVVCHVYTSPPELDLLDEKGMMMANPGLGVFRSREGLLTDLRAALALPDQRSSDENLLLNRRVTRNRTLIPLGLWRDLAGKIDPSIWSDGRKVTIGLDLSKRFDLTSACAATTDDNGNTALKSWVFIPEEGIAERARRDGAAYEAWAQQGLIHLVPGVSMDYAKIAIIMQNQLEKLGCRPAEVHFDRYGASVFRQACEFVGATWAADAEWLDVGQGYKDMSPRVNHFKGLCLEKKLTHPNNPGLNMAVANAIVVEDAAGGIKLDKAKSTSRIDALVAAVMAAYGVREEATTYSSYLDDPDCEGLMII